MFRKNIHLFRGLSIIFVVFSHCYYLGICVFGHNENIFAQIFRNFISGSSAFFVFISGFLFLSIYKSNNDYKKKLYKKIKFVYYPFLIFISFDLVYLIFRVILSFISDDSNFTYYWDRILKFDFVSTYIVGKSLFTFGVLWYIPFIMLVYILSPIFLFYSRYNFSFKISILLISFLISFLIFRNTASNISSLFHNLIYFLPFYFLGIIFYEFEDKLYLKISCFHILILFFISFILGVIYSASPSALLKVYDLMIIQKILFCIAFFVLFKKYKNKLPILSTLANYSFGIYFVHPIVILIILKLISYFNITYKTESFLFYLFLSFFVLLISLGLVIYLKKLLGVRSKYFIGV
jgi:surface polysaccharide O-acyltransferase-like enzyme